MVLDSGREPGWFADEESVREEHTRLRRNLDLLHRQGAELRDRVRAAEAASEKKDKMLQDLLANTRGTGGALGTALDQLREDLQVVFEAKRSMQEVRTQLEDKEQKLVSIQQ